MKVRALIDLLHQCDPEAEVIVNAPFQGFMEVNAILRRADHGGVLGGMSWESAPTVEILNGHLKHMASQGMDVIGPPETE